MIGLTPRTGDAGGNAPRCGIRSCKFLRFVPICPQAVDAEKLNVGAVSPLSPVSPSKMRRFRRQPLCVRIWLAIQWARVSTSAPDVCNCWFRMRCSLAFCPFVCGLPRVVRVSSLVCSGLVSVSVRPERLSVAGTTRDTGHHSRFAPRSSFWPPRHAALAPMALAAASRFIGLSPCPRAPGAPDCASADVARDVRARGRSRCTICGFDAL